MASKRRLRRNRCGDKIKYKNQEDCLLALRIVRRKFKDYSNLSTYKCNFCKQWHIGHMSKKLILIIQNNREH